MEVETISAPTESLEWDYLVQRIDVLCLTDGTRQDLVSLSFQELIPYLTFSLHMYRGDLMISVGNITRPSMLVAHMGWQATSFAILSSMSI